MHDCRSNVPDRPRERLDELGSSALSDAEVIALLLRTGNRGNSALTVATRPSITTVGSKAYRG